MTAGTLGENLSFYSDIHLFEHGRIGFDNRAYVQFSELFERWLPSSALNIKVGQFTIAANPFSMHRDMIILTPLSLATYSPGIGASLEAGHHGATGSLEMTQRGVEIDGVLKHRLTYALGIGNGNGIGEADSTIKYDNNSAKDAHFRLAYKIGGMGFDGYSGDEAGSPTERSEYWLDNSLRIGAFAYLGKAPGSPMEAAGEDLHAPSLLPSKVMDEGDDHDDDMDDMGDMGDMGDGPEFDMRRVGFDVSLYYQNLNLFGAVLLTKDDIPGTDHDPSAVVWFVESDYLFYPWLIGALRYEMVHFKSGEAGAKTENAKRLVPSLTIMARPNVKFILESPINFEDTDDVRIMIDLDFVF